MTQSYSNGGGSGAGRWAAIDLTVTGSFNGSIYDYELLDGSTTFPTGTWFIGGTGYSFIFDFREARVIDEAKLRQSDSSTHGTWQWSGSNDGSSYTNIGGTFTLGGGTAVAQTTLHGNTTAYRYYKCLLTSGSASSSPYLIEWEFQIDTPPSVSYSNTGGYGDRTASITAALTTGTLGGSTTASNLVDGDPTINDAGSFYFATGQTAAVLEFDFGSGATKRIKEVRLLSAGTTETATAWKWEASNDHTNWDLIGTGFHFGGAKRVFHDLSANTFGYRYWRISRTAGTTNNTDYFREMGFQIGDAAIPSVNAAEAQEIDLEAIYTVQSSDRPASVHEVVMEVAWTPDREADVQVVYLEVMAAVRRQKIPMLSVSLVRPDKIDDLDVGILVVDPLP